jgi:Flp pilus assembly pilin Flp
LAAYLLDEDGASAGEYALLLTVLCGCIMMILHVLGRHMDRTIETVANLIEQ